MKRTIVIGLAIVGAISLHGPAQTSNEPRLVRLHSPCEEDEVLQLVDMRKHRKDVYECEHPDNLR